MNSIYDSNDLYPDIKINLTSKVIKQDNGKFSWVMEMHHLTSDDLATSFGKEFDSKREATVNFISDFSKNTEKLFIELMEGL